MADAAQQLDLYQHSPDRMAQAYRVAAETSLHDPFYSPEEQRRRHDYYAAQADRLERNGVGGLGVIPDCPDIHSQKTNR